MSNVEENLKAIVGHDVESHLKLLQGAGLGVLSQYSIGTPRTFENGAVQLPITTLDKTGTVRLHLGNLAMVVRDGNIDEDEIEFLWFEDIGEYAGREYDFYGQTASEIENVNGALDTINRVLGAVDAALNSKAADRLIANATSRGRPVYTEDIQVQAHSRKRPQWGDRGVRVRQPGIQADTRPGVRPVYSGGRKIDVSQIDTRRPSQVRRAVGASAPSTGNLKKDMEKFLASNDAPIWYKSTRVASARTKLRDWIVKQYMAECERTDAHIPCPTFIGEWEPRMLNAGILRTYCKFNSQTVPVEVGEKGYLLCNKESCAKWAAGHGDCSELVLRLAEGY